MSRDYVLDVAHHTPADSLALLPCLVWLPSFKVNQYTFLSQPPRQRALLPKRSGCKNRKASHTIKSAFPAIDCSDGAERFMFFSAIIDRDERKHANQQIKGNSENDASASRQVSERQTQLLRASRQISSKRRSSSDLGLG